MSITKPLPIQPYPGVHHGGNGESEKVGTHNCSAGKNSTKGGNRGLTIRTSRHWVLPPRPKPGRKPNHNHSQNHNGTQDGSKKKKPSMTPGQTQKMQQEVSNKNQLKKEINSIKLENNKLKMELGQLVDSLQDLKQRYNASKSQQEESIKAKIKQKPNTRKSSVVAEDGASTSTSMPASAVAASKTASKTNSRKRQYLDDSTFAFLKFEDDNDEICKDSEDLPLSPLFVSNAKMTSTYSMSSCKTILTDDEDILTVSSSTPNSLFSSDIQHSSSISSASSINVNSNVPSITPHQSNNRDSPGKVPNVINELNFIDNYEQTAFYDKYMCADLAPLQQQQKQYHQQQHQQQGLDAITEEESDFPLVSIVSNDNDNVLNFLQQNNENALPSFADNSVKPCYDDLFFDVKSEENTIDPFQNLSVPQENIENTLVGTATNTTNFYMPPSLEELMEEQDGGAKNFTTTNNNDDALNLHSYDDDFDMLKVEVFDMVN